MFTHNGKEYKSKSAVVREMLLAGETSRKKIASTLGISYAHVYIVEKAIAKKKEKPAKTNTTAKKTTTKNAPRKTKKVVDELDAVQAEVMDNDILDNPIIIDEEDNVVGSALDLD